MNYHSQLREYLAQSQQMLRQKDRFGDVFKAPEQPSSEELLKLEQIISDFSQDPNENLNNLFHGRTLLEFVPANHVALLSGTNFYNGIAIFMKIIDKPLNSITEIEVQNLCKVLLIISAAMTTNSSFIKPLIENSQISLLSKLENLLSNIPASYFGVIMTAEECVYNILCINTDYINMIKSRWGISAAVSRRVIADRWNPNVCHYGIKILNKICENPILSLNNFSVSFFYTDFNSEDMTCDVLTLLAKVISYVNSTKIFQCKKFTQRILILLQNKSFNIQVCTVNILIQLARIQVPDIINDLIEAHILELLLKLAQENVKIISSVLSFVYIVAEFGTNYAEIICNLGYVDLINHAMNAGSFDSQKSAVWLASNIMHVGTFKEIQLLLNPVIISGILEFLNIDSEDNFNFVVLDGICKGLESEAEALSSNLKQALSNQQFFETLHNYFASDDDVNSKLAQIILQKLESDS